MKLFRYGAPGSEKPGVILPNGKAIDTSAIVNDYNEYFFESNGLETLRNWIELNADSAPEIENLGTTTRLGSAVARPSKIICIGLNYSDHAEESNMKIPDEPIVFFKSTSSLVGPNDNLVIPKNSEKTDWEVELAVVIGKKTSYISEKEAPEYIAGYILHNDYSERAFQLERGGQWVKGKSADTFAPLGPFMATADEIPDPQNLRLWLTVNGVTKQDGNTKFMLFNVNFLVSYLSQFMTLLPGDVISTGTPAGVGLAGKPPVYIKPSDVIELGIDGLGTSRQVAVAYPGK